MSMHYNNTLALYASYALHTEPNSKERQEALQVLAKLYQQNPDDLVLGIICETLAGRSVYGDVTFTGMHATAFSTFFNNSIIISSLRDEVSAWTKYITQINPEDSLNLADIGCGDGRAIAQVIKQNFILGQHQSINLFLNDIQIGMLHAAEQLVQNVCAALKVPKLAIHQYHAPAQNIALPKEMQSFFASKLNKVIIIAIGSIHHMPYEQKITLLQQLANLKPRLLVIADANSEHDIHCAPKSPQIIANAMRFFNGNYISLKASGASKEALAAAQFFLGSEARNIIMNDIDKRIDYHTSVDHWKEIVQLAGFNLLDPKCVTPYLANNSSRHLQPTHFDTCGVDGEPLCFSLAGLCLG